MRELVPTVLLAGVLLTLDGPAAAQSNVSVAVSQGVFARNQPFRAVGQRPRWINRADCLADDVLTFQTLVTSVNSHVLEVWAGTGSADCVLPLSGRVAPSTCWLVYRDVPFRTTWPVSIRAQDIVARHYPANAAPSNDVGVPLGTAEDCDSGFEDSVTLHFMFVEGPDVIGTTALWTQTGVDVAPPAPPTELTVNPGDNRLILDWRGDVPRDLLEWRFYCDRAPDGISGAASCPGSTSALVPGQVPPEAYRCGAATGQSTRSGSAEGLVNDTEYAIGAAAIDTSGNVGELSALACGAPALDAEDGVPMASRSCSISRGAGAVPVVEIGGVLLASAVLSRRRATRRCIRIPELR